MDLNDSAENLFLSKINLPVDFLSDELNNSADNLFLSQIDETVLNNEAFLDASFDLGLDLEKFINSCDRSELRAAGTADAGDTLKTAESASGPNRFGSPVTDDEIQQSRLFVRKKQIISTVVNLTHSLPRSYIWDPDKPCRS